MIIDRIKIHLRPFKEVLRLYLNYRHNQQAVQWVEYREWYLKHLKRLVKFRDIHQGEGCFIIGNGPSLKKMDLSPLKQYHTFGLNKIYLMFDNVDLQLSYHVAMNPFVIQQSAEQFESLRCPSFLSYKAAKNFVRPLTHIYFLLTGAFTAFCPDITHGISEGGTVTYAAMQIAFYMGFSQVFLIGVDHHFTTSGNPNEKQVLQGDDLNHFHADYFKNKEWQLPDLEASELSYHLARFYFNRAGRHTYDATVGGKLETFPKISYEQALKMCSNK